MLSDHLGCTIRAQQVIVSFFILVYYFQYLVFYQTWWPQFSWLYIQGSVYGTVISYCKYLGLDSHWESSPNLLYVSSLLINPICPSNKKSIVASVICAVPNS